MGMKKLLCKLMTFVMVCSTIQVPVFAEETQYFCGQEAHAHDQNCYLICEKTLETVEAASGDEIIYHKHEDGCYGAEVTCEKAVHTHVEECEKALEKAEEDAEKEAPPKMLMLAAETHQEHKTCGALSCTEAHDCEEVQWTAVTAADELISAATNGGSVYLAEDVQLSAELEITADLNLCLNDHVLKQTAADTRVISVAAGVKFNLCDCSGTNGTLRYWEKDEVSGLWTLKTSGTTDYTTVGGVITGGYKSEGGGVNNNGTFTMYSGSISGNKAENGGGVFNASEFTMNGGSISGNAYYVGGGVYNTSVFTMNGGSISGNQVSNNGGGVYNINNATFTMEGGSISGNSAIDGGGGVYNYTSVFTMNGGSITGNDVMDYGGGVYNNDGSTFTMENGSISGNKAGSKGGGVYNYDKNVTITLNGGSISGNIIDGSTTASNVYLANDQQITVGESMTEGASFGITVANTKPYTFTKEAVTDDAIKACFFSDDASYGIKKDADGKLQMRESHDHGICGATSCEHTDCMKEWTSVSTTADLIAAAAREGSYYLAADIYLSTELKITANMNLCLNDHVLQQTTAETRVLTVSSGVNFNLCDCKGTNGTTRCWDVAENGLWTLGTSGESENTTVGGVITGGETKKESEYDSEKNGGAVYNYGSFTMYGGNISGNTAGYGSGVWNEKTFTMEGGKISGNTAPNSGGGVYNYENCDFTMNNGEISGNTAHWGGGVYSESTFTMEGGSISGNVATKYGGGVYNNETGIFTMEDGSSISNNKSTNEEGYGGGVYSKGAFTMNGGTISGNGFDGEKGYGGGVWEQSGTFIMNGGKIIGNTAPNSGGGVYNKIGDFTMNNGEISGNKSGYGGGMFNEATFTMEGGNISGNEVTVSGGGVYNMTGSNNGTTIGIFTMNDGIISDNKLTGSNGYGGGVYNKATFDMNDGTISGTKFTGAAKSYGGGVYNNSTGTFTMKGGSISGNELTGASGSNGYGGGVYNYGAFTMEKGSITNNTAYNIGGGVWNGAGSTFTMKDGSIDNNKTLSSGGGGVYNYGTFTMEKGTITNNTAKSYGGGVYNTNPDNGTATFNMEGGSISGNTASSYGGGVYNSSGIFTMEDGSISGNTANSNGGGVYNAAGTFTMKKGTITNNTAKSYGGGVYNTGIFTMEDGSIDNNKTLSSNGGGVYNTKTFTMKNGSISDNKAANTGGGVYNISDFTMEGGSITGNDVSTNGGGLYGYNGTITLKGGSIIGNTKTDTDTAIATDNNIYLNTNKLITVGETMAQSASFGITVANAKPYTFTTAAVENNDFMACFSPDDANCIVKKAADGKLQLLERHVHSICGSAECGDENSHTDCTEPKEWKAVSTETELSAAEAAGGYVYLVEDIKLSAALEISGAVNLCLNGKKLCLAEGTTSSVIIVKEGATLNLCDCSGTNAGTITGGNAPQDGGGVHNKGTFTIYGGSISGNMAANAGGGVYNEGTFTMNGGNISRNTRTDGTTSNVCQGTGGKIFVGTTMAEGANFGITATESVPFTTNAVSDAAMECFFSDNLSYEISKDADGMLQLVARETHIHFLCGSAECADETHTDCDETITWTPVNTEAGLIDAAENGDRVYLAADIELGAALEISDEVNLCLNGHKLSVASNVQDSVIHVAEGATLNLCDCSGTDAGTITGGNAATRNGGGVLNKGTFTMYSGSIGANKAKNGGGVYNDSTGTFNMEGGNISGNEVTVSGGGVYNTGFFTMEDGSISGNTATSSGGGVFNNSTGRFNMEGGSISGNTASNYGGGVLNKGTFNVKNGSISGNTAKKEGGGVSNEGNSFTMTGGTITGNKCDKGGGVSQYTGSFTLSGGTITGNTKLDEVTVNNVYLQNNKLLTVGATMAEGASFGITAVNAKPYTFTTNIVEDNTIMASFFSDDANYIIGKDGEGKLQLEEGFTVTVNATLGSDPSDEMFADGMVLKLKNEAYEGDLTKSEAGVYQLAVKQGTYTLQYGTGDEWTVITDSLEVTDDTTVDQTWYQVEFDDSKTFELAGKKIVAPAAPEKEGYKFLGWNFNGTLYQPGEEITATLNDHVKATAEFTDKFTVTVNATLGSDPSDEMFADGMVLKLKNEAYEGDLTKSEAGVYQLAVKEGTYTLQYGTGDEWTVITDSLEVTGDTTVDQTWYQVEFGESKTYELGGKEIEIEVPAAPEKEGYKFLGWNFNGTLYQPGDVITTTLGGHIQVTAEFTDDFTVTVNTKLGADLSDEMFADGMVLKLTKDAYEAELTRNETGVYQLVVKPGTYTLHYGTTDEWTVITDSLEVTYDTTVDQAWYQVAFDESETIELAGKEIVAPAAPEKEGEEFLGWSYNGKLYQPGDAITSALDSHIQATATFGKKFTVTVNAMLGADLSDDMFADGKVLKLTNTEYEGELTKDTTGVYQFVVKEGTYTLQYGTGDEWTVITDSLEVTGDKTVDQTWYQVEFGESKTYELAGKKIVAPAAPTKEGYKFLGWSYNDTLYQPGDVITSALDAHIKVTAAFSKVEGGDKPGGDTPGTDKPVTPPSGGSSSSGGGGGGGGTPAVNVVVSKAENGKVMVDTTNAKKDSVVTITVTPDAGYAVGTIKVIDSDGKEVKVTENGDGKYTFIKPSKKVTISVDFIKAEAAKADKITLENVDKAKALVLTINRKEADVFGKEVVNDVAPIIRQERTMLPIRIVVEALGGKIAWNAAERKVSITKGEQLIEIVINNSIAYVNGKAVQLDAPAFIEGGRTYLPLRFVAENLNANVLWDAKTKQIIIVPKAEPAAIAAEAAESKTEEI